MSKPVGFLDLPAELRITIFKHVLTSHEPIEFWPETGNPRAIYVGQFRTRKKLGRLFGRRELNVGLLRTCKQINTEAAEYFYKNEFRFSAINGCIVASAFLHTIGPVNISWLTNLTIAVPFQSQDPTVYAVDCNPHTFKRFAEIYRGSARPGFRYPNQHRDHGQWWNYRRSFCLFAWNLTQHATRLTKLTFVVPENTRPHTYWGFMNYLSNKMIWDAIEDLATEKPLLELEVVHMTHEQGWDRMTDEVCNILSYIGDAMPLTLRHAFFHEKGEWTIN